jgi:hypothetical protein
VNDFIEECAAFPNGAHDDQVDAMTQALLRWNMAIPRRDYQEMLRRVLMDLCVTYHRLLYDLCNRFPAGELGSAVCRVGYKEPRTLLDLLRDYVANLNRSVREVSR